MKESSLVLARKYRPKRFEDLIGQDTITQTLSLALDSNRLSHAYLFSGLRGSGKTSTARIFAKALTCDHAPTSKPCDVCENCIMANESRHIDIVEMDAASSRKIDDIRDLIEATKYKPAIAKYKIFIIDEVHMLTKEAFNALLKTLEEPPSYVKFILATTDPLKLPATILSRTQHFRFKRISNTNIANHLMHILNIENIEFQHEALEMLARSGSGSLRDTLTLLDQAIIYSKNFVDLKTVSDMLGLIDPEFISKIFDAIFKKESSKIRAYIKELENYEAEMVVDEFIAYLKERFYENDSKYSTIILDRFFRILSESKMLFTINADGGFVLSLIFFKMIEALKIKEIDQMIESLESQIERPKTFHLPLQSATLEDEQSNSSIQIVETKEEVDQNRVKFDKLISMISDRNSDLGECFRDSVEFISFENETLIWESCANDECKNLLKHGYSVIRQFVREIYGFETQIKHQLCSKEILEKKNDSFIEAQSGSTIEDIETGMGSCVSGCENTPREIDGVDILEQPMIKKAIELFEATKITVQSKI